MFIMPFTTKRINAKMRELTMREAIDLCAIPDHLQELGISRALQAVVAETNLPLEQWTVQERMAAVGHYITAQEEGDWALLDGVSYAQCLLEQDYPEQPYRFEQADGAMMEIVPLTGEYAEACERAVVGLNAEHFAAAGNWVMAAMAATVRLAGSEWDGTADEFVQENIKRLQELPESAFAELHNHFQAAWQQMAHGFHLAFDADGLFALARVQEGGAGLVPVRFQFIACIGSATAALWRPIK